MQELWKEKEELEKKIGELEKASKRSVAPFRIEDEKRKEKNRIAEAKEVRG